MRKYILTSQLQNVIGMEITGWSLPNNLAPSFFPYNPLFPNISGDDYVDFTLTCAVVNGGLPKTFSFQFASKAFLFSRTDAVSQSYCDILENLLLQTIKSDVDFGNNVDFIIERDVFLRTRIVIVGKNLLLGQEIFLSFIFLSGINNSNSAYRQMGFNKQDYTSSLIVTIPPIFSHELISPEVSIMMPRKFVDVYIEEYPLSNHLVKRIYACTAGIGVSNELILYNQNNTRIFNNKIIKTLTQLNITLLLPNGQPAPTTDQYDLEITIYHNNNEIVDFKDEKNNSNNTNNYIKQSVDF